MKIGWRVRVKCTQGEIIFLQAQFFFLRKLLGTLVPIFKENGWHYPSQEWGINLAGLIGPSMVLINDGVDQAKPFFEEPDLNVDGKKQLEIFCA